MSRINHRNEAQILRAESDHITKCFVLSFVAAWLFGVLMVVASRTTPLPWVILVVLMAGVFLSSWSLTVRKLDRVTDALLKDCDCSSSRKQKSSPPTPPADVEFVQVLDENGRYKFVDKRRVGG